MTVDLHRDTVVAAASSRAIHDRLLEICDRLIASAAGAEPVALELVRDVVKLAKVAGTAARAATRVALDLPDVFLDGELIAVIPPSAWPWRPRRINA
ncbi:MAG: hypothetical protein NT062_31920 [Proteobacteria bacterium]|nr:hypothetical protein [Pseudomonadota bacterium]